MSESIGSRIATIRGARGVGEFADALGVNRKTITRWEANDALPDGASLIALKEKFGADPGWVLCGAGEAPTNSTLSVDERELLALYRAASLTGKMSAVGALQGAMSAQPKARQVFNAEVGSSTNVEGNLKQEGISFFKGKRQKK